MRNKNVIMSMVGILVLGLMSYTYSSYKNKQVESSLLLENIEAFTQGESSIGWEISSGPCPHPIQYKKWITCKRGGEETDCMPSDC